MFKAYLVTIALEKKREHVRNNDIQGKEFNSNKSGKLITGKEESVRGIDYECSSCSFSRKCIIQDTNSSGVHDTFALSISLSLLSPLLLNSVYFNCNGSAGIS